MIDQPEKATGTGEYEKEARRWVTESRVPDFADWLRQRDQAAQQRFDQALKRAADQAAQTFLQSTEGLQATHTADLDQYKAALRLIRTTLGLPAEHPDGTDLKERLGEVAALRALADKLAMAAKNLLETGEWFAASKDNIFAAMSSHDYIEVCRCGGCRLWRMFTALTTEVAALRAALSEWENRGK